MLTSCNSIICPGVNLNSVPGGDFKFCPCSNCDQFRVTPAKNDDWLNGVSTFDLTLIDKHILGVEYLNSPYKIIAADVNKSNTVTTYDMVELRKLILGIYTEIPGNTSWRFVDKDHIFPDLCLRDFQNG